MLQIENTEVHGWQAAIRGMRNPKNSWDRMDTRLGLGDSESSLCIGQNDLTLMRTLAEAGAEHRKYMRFIMVTADVTAPLYWWKEYDTYKVGTVANSCSTMHKIHAKRFTPDDFSCEHLLPESRMYLTTLCGLLNACREWYQATHNKQWWWQMIQLLPTSYNQRRTVMLNYEVLTTIYRQRKNHKLDEWHTFCHWIESLPYAEIMTGGMTGE